MSILIGGVGTSHAPSIAGAYDAKLGSDPKWAEVFSGFNPVSNWLEESKVDTLITIYNDHLNTFKFNAYPNFALGVAGKYPVADEGRGARKFEPVPGDAEFSWHLANELSKAEFDLTLCQEMNLDHGVMSVLPLFVKQPWNLNIIPLAVNVILYPLPSPMRCYKLGNAIRKAIDSDSGNRRIAVMASGGLSHQLHGPDFGKTNPDWDMRFMDLIENNPEILAEASHEDFVHRGGAESVEMMLWLTMAGAIKTSEKRTKRIHKYYSAPNLTGYGVLALELIDQ
jgi:hypothetical protein